MICYNCIGTPHILQVQTLAEPKALIPTRKGVAVAYDPVLLRDTSSKTE